MSWVYSSAAVESIDYRTQDCHGAYLMSTGQVYWNALPDYIHTDQHLNPKESCQQHQRTPGRRGEVSKCDESVAASGHQQRQNCCQSTMVYLADQLVLGEVLPQRYSFNEMV